jgi:ribosomal-protein-alanine N-acetyltransferase
VISIRKPETGNVTRNHHTPAPLERAVITTPRLRLRHWHDSDLEPFAALNADPEVARYLGGALDRAASDALAVKIRRHFELHGFGLYAVEIEGVCAFGGFVGLSIPTFEAHFTPCVEIGWRLARSLWRRGYASEAARAVLQHGFEQVGLDEIVSFTARRNQRSIAVMQRLGMQYSGEFSHPGLPRDHSLCAHVLYRLRRDAAEAAASSAACFRER